MSSSPSTPFEKAFAFHQKGQLAEAYEIYQQLLSNQPDHPELLHMAGLVLHQMGNHDAAVPLLSKAVSFAPENSGYLYNLGVVLQRVQRLEDSESCYRKVIALDPGNLSAWINLGNQLSTSGRFGEACECHRNTLRLQPENGENHARLARALRMMGDIENSLAHLGIAISLSPDDLQTGSELLFTSQYEPGVSLADLAWRHGEWASKIPETKTTAQDLKVPSSPLRVGFLSPDFGNHPVGIFIAPLLERLKKHADIIAICFSDREFEDEFALRNREAANEWHLVYGMPDNLLEERVRSASLDILIELTGHTEQNRMPLLKRRLAPIQMSWAGYVGTTGLDAIDFLLTDAYHCPDGSEDYYFETLLRFPNDYIPYEPPSYAPLPGALPMLRNGHATFGCLNNPAKLTGATIKLWAQILREAPDSRMILKYKGMDDSSVRDRVLGLFSVHGVDPQRIEMLGQTNHKDHLSVFQKIDVALDPLPYSGGLSTCEAIWMGVPVITFPGDTFASRHSLSHLSNAGFPQFAATDQNDYARKALNLIGNPKSLALLREEMRDTVSASPLCDLDAYADDFVAAIKLVAGIEEEEKEEEKDKF